MNINNKTLEEKGYHCRESNEEGESIFLICHLDTPEIFTIFYTEWGLEGFSISKDRLSSPKLLGSGETVRDAWEKAIREYANSLWRKMQNN